MNKNIEIIAPHLWAVRFSWLPWITDIKLELDPSIPTDEQILAVSDKKVIILNADNSLFPLYRTNLQLLRRLKLNALKQELLNFECMKNRSAKIETYLLMLQIEIKRRKLAAKSPNNHNRKGVV